MQDSELKNLSPAKKKFQLERMLFFSDAVFAIAITLMVIEIKIPVFTEDSTNADVGNYFLSELPKFMSYILSFFMVAIYWIVHHRLFAYVNAHDERMIWLNMLFLMFIGLIPYSSGLFGDNSGVDWCFIFYCGNMVAIGIFSLLLLLHVIHSHLSEGLEDKKLVRYYIARNVVVMGVYTLAIVLCLFHSPHLSMAARWSLMLILPGLMIVRRRMKPTA